MNSDDREKALARIMADHGCSREHAEFVLALELGEIEGDIVEIEGGAEESDEGGDR